jgi:hypothetical protein
VRAIVLTAAALIALTSVPARVQTVAVKVVTGATVVNSSRAPPVAL